MAKIDRSFVAWEEHIVCSDKGNRLVHYYLKNASGESVLAVIGTERSIRHMTYVVVDEFVQVYERDISFNEGLKWRARRDVVEWLTSLASNHAETLHTLNMETHDSVHASGSNILQTSYLMAQRKVRPHNQKLDWYGNAYLCAKQLKHYQAFCATETIVAVHSFVFIMAEEESNYLGYIEDMYEDKRGNKKIKIRWFHYGKEVKGVIPELNLAPREVLITNHVQVISAECFDCPAIVLTPSHYEKCLKVIPDPSTLGIYMCFRQFNNNKIKSFCLAKLRGYVNQAILPCLDGPKVDRDRVKSNKLNIPDEVKSTCADIIEVGIKRKRTGKGNQGPAMRIAKNSSAKGCVVKGDKIELLCQDSGIRGCWFRCRILRVSDKKLKVEYEDLEDADGPKKLKEWVSAHRVAAPDKLGMRCVGRPTIRPCPDNSEDCLLYIGAPIDAWWCDGWWEGVVIGHDNSETDTLQVYLPGENNFLVIEKKNIRRSRDWIGNNWISVKAKLDIIHYISSNVIPGTEPSGRFNLIRVPGRSGLALPQHESNTASRLGAIEEVESEGLLGVARDTENKKSSEHEGILVSQSGEAAPLNVDKPVLADILVHSADQMCEAMEAAVTRVPACSGLALPQHESNTASGLVATEEVGSEAPLEVTRATESKSACEHEDTVNQPGETPHLNVNKPVLADDLVDSADQMCEAMEAAMTRIPACGGLALPQHGIYAASRLAIEEDDNAGPLEVAKAIESTRVFDRETIVNQSGKEATLNQHKSTLSGNIVDSGNQTVNVIEVVNF